MFTRNFKTGYFIIEALNSFALVYFQFYFFYFARGHYGFSNEANLALAAMNGVTYALCSWWSGRFAQRVGYPAALKLGLGLMMAALLAGLLLRTAPGHVAVMLITVAGMSLTWSPLEALVSEGETRAGLQHMLGVYNVVWAATGALASFLGGTFYEKLGWQSLFYLPAAIQFVQLVMVLWLERQARRAGKVVTLATGAPAPAPSDETGETTAPAVARSFLRMAWLANPFGYIAIQTAVAIIPSLAARLELSTMLAGFCCSVWCFARFGAFVVLWLWNGWHYRFRWLLAAYAALVLSFALILTVPSLVVLVAAQAVFGGAIGLLYYSSLFYSMAGQEATRGEHGGIHEAVIGLGNFAGPAAGAVSLHFLPQRPDSGAVAVSGLLLIGLGGLLAFWRHGLQRAQSSVRTPKVAKVAARAVAGMTPRLGG